MYILNIPSTLKKMSVNEIKDFIFENYYKRIVFSKENRYYSMKKKICCCLQLNKQTKYLILVMLKNTFSHL